MACGSLALQLGLEARPSAVGAQSPNHWTAREFPTTHSFKKIFFNHFTYLFGCVKTWDMCDLSLWGMDSLAVA